MESLEVIAKVTEPTDWVNSIATPEKQRTGALRVCLDPRDLNQAVKREHYPLPTLEELTLMLSDTKYFSVLDATSGFWQIKLDEESSLLTTFNTPFGRYRFTRMPFGIHSAQEVFQKTMAWTWHLKASIGANPSLMICLSGDHPRKNITII